MKEKYLGNWKVNNRNGPFDWWVGCKVHGGLYFRGCLGCFTAELLNRKFYKDNATAPAANQESKP